MPIKIGNLTSLMYLIAGWFFSSRNTDFNKKINDVVMKKCPFTFSLARSKPYTKTL
jgi:hypothetical protein